MNGFRRRRSAPALIILLIYSLVRSAIPLLAQSAGTHHEKEFGKGSELVFIGRVVLKGTTSARVPASAGDRVLEVVKVMRGFDRQFVRGDSITVQFASNVDLEPGKLVRVAASPWRYADKILFRRENHDFQMDERAAVYSSTLDPSLLERVRNAHAIVEGEVIEVVPSSLGEFGIKRLYSEHDPVCLYRVA